MKHLTPIHTDSFCVLISVYHPYRWIAPHTWKMIQTFWPNHPPVFFCGLTSEEAGELPHIPVHEGHLPRVWADFVFDAAAKLKADGFEAVYFFLEDHMPLDACHELNLNTLLPALLNTLPASYIGLMGWDNKRFATRAGPVLPAEHHRLKHLTTERAPRFHLHPSLFRMDALIECLEALKQHDKPNPWGFEKLSDKLDAPISKDFKESCYQICGSELALNKPRYLKLFMETARHWFFHRMMSLVPLACRLGFGKQFFKFIGFDDFFYNGPFPMFYSGVMAAGKINPFFTKHLKRRNDRIFDELLQEISQREAQ